MFEGLTDEEEAEESSTGSGTKTDFFVPRRNVKKLQLKAVSLDTTTDADIEKQQTPEVEAAPSPSTEEDSTPANGGRNRPALDDSITVLNIRRPPLPAALLNSSLASERSSFLDETGIGEGDRTVMEEINEVTSPRESIPPHPAGLMLRRVGYYTIPSMEELAIKGLDADGKCIVDSFTVGRHNYGHVFFSGPLDVANLNLDEIGMF